MTVQLFTQYFLTDGIRATPEWRASVSWPGAFAAFRDGLRGVFETFGRFTRPNESVTEQDLIRPILALLGWTDSLPQQGTARNEDIPDHLLFADAQAKARAAVFSGPSPALRRFAGRPARRGNARRTGAARQPVRLQRHPGGGDRRGWHAAHRRTVRRGRG